MYVYDDVVGGGLDCSCRRNPRIRGSSAAIDRGGNQRSEQVNAGGWADRGAGGRLGMWCGIPGMSLDEAVGTALVSVVGGRREGLAADRRRAVEVAAERDRFLGCTRGDS